MADQVPIIDIADLDSAALAQRRAVGDAIGRACEDIGFFYVTGHSVAQITIDAALNAAEAFFALPLEEKCAVHIRNSRNHRGYVPVDEELLDAAAGHEPREAIDFGAEIAADDPLAAAGPEFYGPNQWPLRPAGLRSAVEEYHAAMLALSRRLARGFALALDMPEDFFVARMTHPLALMRLLRYPAAQSQRDRDAYGIGAHSDYECYTILWQDDCGGLELLNADGHWVPAPPRAGTFVVNIGDLMARWSNDRFKSTQHRVKTSDPSRSRFSIPCFLGPNHDTLVECLPTCCGPGNPPRYPPVGAGEYQLSRLGDTFAYLKTGTDAV
jgi:isopenicillin N synthase-like dioxygenase